MHVHVGMDAYHGIVFERVSIDALKTTYELIIGLENGARFFNQPQRAAVEDKSNHKISSAIDTQWKTILRLFSLQFIRVLLSRFIFSFIAWFCSLVSVRYSQLLFPLFFRALLRFHCISCDRPVDMIPGQ